MKLNKLSLSLAITLALGSTFGMAHAETTTTTKTPVVTNAKASAHTTTAAKTTAKTTHAKTTAAKTTPAATAKSTTTTDKTTTTAKATQKSEAPAKAKETLPAGVYPDTKDNWARDAIQAMTEAGYLSGYADNTFRPGKSITREQAAAIYGKVLQHNMNEQELADLVTKENGVSYSDVESDRWSNTAIKLVGAAGVMEGTTKSTFAPAKAMDREEFVASAANLVKKIKTDRELDVFDKFNTWLQYYMKIPQNKHDFKVVCDDYANVLKNLSPGEVEVVYADPPYTRYHYSRYYHILETLCLHDTPSISTTFPNGKGGLSRAIYRNDRHQSPFCIKSKAPEAFENLFKYAKKAQASVVLSYSPFDKASGATPRLLSIEEILQIARKYYEKVEVISPGQFMHSRFNKLDNNYEINYEAERLIICRK